jgi:hypothetical protein
VPYPAALLQVNNQIMTVALLKLYGVGLSERIAWARARLGVYDEGCQAGASSSGLFDDRSNGRKIK